MTATRSSLDELDPHVVDRVRERLADRPGELSPHRVAEALRAAGRPVGDATVLAVYEALRRDVLGAGPLEPLLRLPGVTDVLVNGAEQVFVDRGAGLEPTGVRFPDDESVRRLAQRLASMAGRRLAQRLASMAGRRLDDHEPFVDLRLPDGSRCHAVLAPVSRPGTTISLRVPPARAFTLDELVAAGTITQAQADAILAGVEAKAPVPGDGTGPGGMGGPGRGGKGHGGFGGRGGASLEAAATALGITTDELKTELQADKTIADVATEKGVDVQTVIDAMVAAETADITERVTNAVNGIRPEKPADAADPANPSTDDSTASTTTPTTGG